MKQINVPGPPYHDLDPLSGIWAKEEAQTFQENLAFQRRIDEELWKQTK